MAGLGPDALKTIFAISQGNDQIANQRVGQLMDYVMSGKQLSQNKELELMKAKALKEFQAAGFTNDVEIEKLRQAKTPEEVALLRAQASAELARAGSEAAQGRYYDAGAKAKGNEAKIEVDVGGKKVMVDPEVGARILDGQAQKEAQTALKQEQLRKEQREIEQTVAEYKTDIGSLTDGYESEAAYGKAQYINKHSPEREFRYYYRKPNGKIKYAPLPLGNNEKGEAITSDTIYKIAEANNVTPEAILYSIGLIDETGKPVERK